MRLIDPPLADGRPGGPLRGDRTGTGGGYRAATDCLRSPGGGLRGLRSGRASRPVPRRASRKCPPFGERAVTAVDHAPSDEERGDRAIPVSTGPEIDRASNKNAYEQVTDAIAARIASGQYTSKLPGERALAKELAVSYITVRHATAILRQRGLIISSHGRGTYVAPGFRPGREQAGPAGPGQAGMMTAR